MCLLVVLGPFELFFEEFFVRFFLCLLVVSGPFDDTLPKLKDKLQALTSMQQTFSLTDTGMLADFGLTEFRWNIVINYESDGGRIGMSLDLTKVCFSPTEISEVENFLRCRSFFVNFDF